MTHMPYNNCSKCGVCKPIGPDTYCKPCRSQYAKAWKAANIERSTIKRREYYEANKSKWRERNKIEFSAYRTNRASKDPKYKAKLLLRAALYRTIIKGKISPKIKEFIGCSVQEFRFHLESQFKSGMSWDTYGRGLGRWSMDHIKPLCDFDLTDADQARQAFHYSNTRPLCDIENSTRYWK